MVIFNNLKCLCTYTAGRAEDGDILYVVQLSIIIRHCERGNLYMQMFDISTEDCFVPRNNAWFLFVNISLQFIRYFPVV